ncbi:hypothetical protein [Flavobacterium sp. NRK F7]|uniref:hypothetical protein n=1 Tax=Flavobacterium sp. NRK F7 TaxID=2954930 RepID=UPI00209048B2|nr:hypothetical protein [Flavobacterium sp. NRK F7]MCO6164478.1 hypothetical protein [Flavobacterium sp. NRK F7]
MRNILLLFILFCGNYIFSQNFENISKIKFSYIHGGSSWGKNGIYSRSEIFELTKTENGDFKISQHLKINQKVHNKVFSEDSITINTSNYKTIPKSDVDYLLTSLNTNKENFTEEFLIQNFTKPTKKEILKIAKQNGDKNYLKNDYDEKNDTEKKYSEIQNYKYFDEYLKLNQPILNVITLTFDAWNSLGIITFSKEETKLYDLDFPKYCGHPISVNYIEIKEKDKKINIIENKSSSIINLDVNLILLKILPKNTKLSVELNLNNIRDEYINWFLENKRTEFEY